MKKKTIRLGWLSANFYFLGLAIAAETDPPDKDSSPEATWEVRSRGWTAFPTPGTADGGSENQMFVTGDAAQQAMEETRDKLKHPEGRTALRREQRTMLEQMHPDIEQELGIDVSTKDKLMELLVDEQLIRLESSFEMQRDHEAALQKQADAETQRLSSLLELLGRDGLAKFQSYLSTSWEREQVKRFDALLPTSAKLQSEQKSKLAQVFLESNERKREQDLRSRRSRDPLGAVEGFPSPEEMQRQSELLTIEANEAALRQAQEENPLLERRAAEFLSSEQLAALSRMNEEAVAQLRQWIEQARLQAGLSPQVPEHSEPLVPRAAPRKPVVGEATFEFNVAVNGSAPILHTHTGPNAKPIVFEAGDGLWIEATPTLYEDHWLDVHLAFYEQIGSEKRRIENGSSFGTLTRVADGTFSGGGTSTDVVTGSKGYAVKTQVKVVVP